MTVIVPFIGQFLLLNEHILSFFSQQVSWVVQDAISSVFFLYFGLIFVGLSTIIYQLFCHHLVKRFDTSDTFVAQTLDFTSKSDFSAYCEALRGKTSATIEEKVALLHVALGLKSLNEIGADLKIEIKKAYYELLDRRLVILRSAASIMYLIGLGLLISRRYVPLIESLAGSREVIRFFSLTAPLPSCMIPETSPAGRRVRTGRSRGM